MELNKKIIIQKTKERIMVSFSTVLLIISIGLFFNRALTGLVEDNYLVNVTFEFVGVVLLTIFQIGGLLDRSARTSADNEFVTLMFYETIAIFFDSIAWYSDHYYEYTTFNLMSNTIYYIMVPIVALQFWRYVVELCTKKAKYYKHTLYSFNIIVALYTVFTLFNLKYNQMFSVVNGNYSRNSLYIVSFIVPVTILIFTVIYVVSRKMPITDKMSLLCFPLLPFILSVFQVMKFGVSFFCIGLFISTSIVYVNVFVTRGKTLVLQNNELEKQRSETVFSQIRPHFLYNALSSIAALCDTDPKLAKETTLHFSDYLRANMNTLDNAEFVDFEREMRHVDNYLSIEKVRFNDILEYDYDIEYLDFKIPKLILQPIVENAVRHGICKKENGGIILISSKKIGEFVEISVKDDGIGFDTTSEQLDMKGYKSIINRLKVINNASISIQSEIGSGTEVTIIIPIEQEEI